MEHACVGDQVCCVLTGQTADVCRPSVDMCASVGGGSSSNVVECDDPSDCERGYVCCGEGGTDFVNRAQCFATV